MKLQGAFEIESFTLINQHGQNLPIDNIVGEFVLNESIYNKFCSATLAISDGIDFPKNFRLSGQETVRIALAVTHGDAMKRRIDTVFRIFKIEKVQRESSGAGITQNYLIKLCDPHLFECRRIRLSQVFRGSYSDILKDKILKSIVNVPNPNSDSSITSHFDMNSWIDEDHWESTLPDTKQFISPNWTVANIIDYCVDNAHAEGATAWRNGMFFYQVLNGGSHQRETSNFRFQSIDHMFSDVHDETFTLMPMSDAPLTVGQDYQNVNINEQIMSIHKPQLFDTLKGTVGGAYASRLNSYDPVKKLTQDHLYDIEETFNRGKASHLSNEPMIQTNQDEKIETMINVSYDNTSWDAAIELYSSGAPNTQYDSSVIYDSKMVHPFDNRTDVNSDEIFSGKQNLDNSQLERLAMKETLDQHRIVIGLPFRTDISVGQVIKLNLPAAQPYEESVDSKDHIVAEEDGLYSYLVTDIALRGFPDTGVGSMTLECVKESFAKKLGDHDPMEEALKLTTALPPNVASDGVDFNMTPPDPIWPNT